MSEKLESIEAYTLATIGAIQGIFKYCVKEPIMEFRLNNQTVRVEDLSDQAKEDVARTVAFNRDAAIGQLALLGLPADHPYAPKSIEDSPTTDRPAQLSLDNHQGFTLGH